MISFLCGMFYHSEKLQSTKTSGLTFTETHEFYHSEKLQSTKTRGYKKN